MININKLPIKYRNELNDGIIDKTMANIGITDTLNNISDVTVKINNIASKIDNFINEINKNKENIKLIVYIGAGLLGLYLLTGSMSNLTIINDEKENKRNRDRR